MTKTDVDRVIKKLRHRRGMETYVGVCWNRRVWTEMDARYAAYALSQHTKLPHLVVRHLTDFWLTRIVEPVVDPMNRKAWNNLLLREGALGPSAHYHWIVIGRPQAKSINSRFHLEWR